MADIKVFRVCMYKDITYINLHKTGFLEGDWQQKTLVTPLNKGCFDFVLMLETNCFQRENKLFAG